MLMSKRGLTSDALGGNKKSKATSTYIKRGSPDQDILLQLQRRTCQEMLGFRIIFFLIGSSCFFEFVRLNDS